MRNPNVSCVKYAAKAKVQISCAVAAQLISTYVFATQIVQLLFFLKPNFKLLAIFYEILSDLI